MEYTINKLAKLSGISTRTLRYYDEIDLLVPDRVSSNDYRIYGQVQVNLLQQILFYRQLGMPLNEIKSIITSPDFDKIKALEEHLTSLKEQLLQTKVLMKNITDTINAMKGDYIMSDEEKFKGFKKQLMNDNQTKYGDELLKKYGEITINESNQKLAGMTKEQWSEQERLSQQILDLLKIAMSKDDPTCTEAQDACDAHRQWLSLFWKDGLYSKEIHLNLGEMYLSDQRFKSYYDNAVGTGATEFLYEALKTYIK
jgi:Predicted transcriptional regulators